MTEAKGRDLKGEWRVGVFNEDAKRSTDIGQPKGKGQRTTGPEYLLNSPNQKFRVQIDAKTKKGQLSFLAFRWKPKCGLEVLCQASAIVRHQNSKYFFFLILCMLSFLFFLLAARKLSAL